MFNIKYINKIYSILSPDNSKIQDEHTVKINEKIDSKELLEYLILSILTAEYYNDFFLVELRKLEALINEIKNAKATPHNILKKYALRQILDIDNYFYHYKEFKAKLDSSIENDDKIFIELSYLEYIKCNDIEISNSTLWIFSANLYLAQLDEGYICNRDTLLDLITFSTKLNNWIKETEVENNKLSIELLTAQKFDFLILKTLIRFDKTIHKEFVITNKTKYKSLSLDTEIEFKFSKEDIINRNNNALIKNKFIEEFLVKSEFIYDASKLSLADLSNKIKLTKLLKKELSDIKIYDIHFLCKIIKHNTSDIINGKYTNITIISVVDFLKKVVTYYEAKCAEESKVNKYSNYSGLNLLINSITKIELEDEKCKISEITNINEIAKIISNRTALIKARSLEFEMNNSENDISSNKFNPAFQFGRFIAIYLKNLGEVLIQNIQSKNINIYDKNFHIITSEYKNIVAKIISHLEKCIINIDEAKDRKALPIYVSLKECLVEDIDVFINNNNVEEKVNIFLDSSYILPANYEHLYKCIRADISLVRNSEFEFYNTISRNYYNSFEEKNKIEFDKTIKENQVNAIQVIGLYAGFITFVLGSISIIPKFEVSYVNLLLFLLVFSTSLCLFVFMLRVLISNKDETYNSITEIIGVYRKRDDTGKEIIYYKREPFVFAFFFILLSTSLFMLWINRQSDHKYLKKSLKKDYSIKAKIDSLRKNIKDTIHYSETIEESNYLPKQEDKSK